MSEAGEVISLQNEKLVKPVPAIVRGWLIVRRVRLLGRRGACWECRCLQCESIRVIRSETLRAGSPEICKCRRLVDLTGVRFGRWIVIARTDRVSDSYDRFWLCQCDCGTEREVRRQTLIKKESTSCGCKRFHGMTHSPVYAVWNGIKQRCTNPNTAEYQDYGGRGIKMYEPWFLSIKQFAADVGPRPTGKTMDRINNDGNYEPGNVRWATPLEQAHNRRPAKRRAA